MEQPKQKHLVLFIFATLCSVLAVGFFAFFMYIAPHILFDMHYDVPEYVIELTVFFKEHHDIDGLFFIGLVLLPLLVGCFIFAYLARKLSDAMQPQREDDNQAVGLATELAATQPAAGAEDRQITYSMKPTATEVVDEEGNTVRIEDEKIQLIAEPSKPELFETAKHIEPIRYSKWEALTLAAKLGILIAGIVLLIILADYLIITDMAHLIR